MNNRKHSPVRIAWPRSFTFSPQSVNFQKEFLKTYVKLFLRQIFVIRDDWADLFGPEAGQAHSRHLRLRLSTFRSRRRCWRRWRRQLFRRQRRVLGSDVVLRRRMPVLFRRSFDFVVVFEKLARGAGQRPEELCHRRVGWGRVLEFCLKS